MRLTIVAVLALATLPSHSGAQVRQAPAPGVSSQGAVDPLTASITGAVTAVETGAPIRGAEVRATSDSGISRLAATDAGGGYQFRDLPAGTYTVNVSKSGFVPGRFGQRRPGDAATAVELSQGEQFTAGIALLRGGVIAGRIVDRYGEPLAGVRVQALRPRMVEGRRRLQTLGPGDTTDDTGSFRIHGIAPGEYYLTASTPQGEMLQVRGVPLYYPGTVDFTEAQPITVTAGGEANAFMQIVPVSAATVSGVVLGSSGLPVEAMVSLTSDAVGLGYVNTSRGEIPFMITGHADRQGRFTLTDVPPGPYTLNASYVPPPSLVPGGPPPMLAHEMANVPVVVSGGNVPDLAITLSSGGTIAGTFVRDGGVTRPLPPGLSVTAAGGGMSMRNTGPNGSFRILGAVGPVRLFVDGLPDGWTVKAIEADGNDVTDVPLTVNNGRSATVRVVLTDRVTEVRGSVIPAGAPGGQTVLVFADDASRWTYPSRFVRAARSDEEGRFTIAGLPPERYLAVAVDYLEDGESQDPAVLERLRAGAVAFSLAEGERRTLELRAIEP